MAVSAAYPCRSETIRRSDTPVAAGRWEHAAAEAGAAPRAEMCVASVGPRAGFGCGRSWKVLFFVVSGFVIFEAVSVVVL